MPLPNILVVGREGTTSLKALRIGVGVTGGSSADATGAEALELPTTESASVRGILMAPLLWNRS